MDATSLTIKWVAGDGASYRTSTAVTYSGMSAYGEVLYLFMDESGNLDFGKNGSTFFYMTCLAVRRPFSLEMPLTSLRYDFMEDGTPMEAFHACEDTPLVRRTVLKRLSQESHNLAAYTICIEKQMMPEEMRNAETLYSKAFEWITSEVYSREVTDGTEQVIVITDDLPKTQKRRQVEKPLKAFMKRRFQNEGLPYTLLHHKSCASVYLQIADYLSWVVQRKVSKNERWPMDMVSDCYKEIGTMRNNEMEEGSPQ